MQQAFAFGKVVVDDVHLAAGVLREPDAGVGHAEIPPRIDAQRWVMRHRCDARGAGGGEGVGGRVFMPMSTTSI